MTIIERTGLRYGAVILPQNEWAEPSSLIETTVAHLNTQNTVGLALGHLSEHWEPVRQLFYGDIDPKLKEMEFNINSLKETHYEPYQKDFLDVTTEAQAMAKKQRIDRELHYNDVIARGGLGTNIIAGLAAGALDPTTWLLVGSLSTAARATRMAAKISETAFMEAGLLAARQTSRVTTLGYAALEGVTVAGIEAITSEAIKHELSYTRTTAESAIVIGSSVLLGGILGGAKSYDTQTLRNAWRNKVQRYFTKDMNNIASNGTVGGPSPNKPQSPSNVAQALSPAPSTAPPSTGFILVGGVAGKGQTLVGGVAGKGQTTSGKGTTAGKGQTTSGSGGVPPTTTKPSPAAVGNIAGWQSQSAQKALSWFGKATPGNRLAMSPSLEAQKSTQKLITYGFMLDDNVSYKASNPRTVHVMATRWQNVANDIWATTMVDCLKKLREAGYKYSKDKLSKDIYAHYTNGTKHPIKTVENAIEDFDQLFIALRKLAIDAGLFSKNIKTKYASGYLPRLWNNDAIRKNRMHFTDLIINGHKNTRNTNIAKTNTLQQIIHDLQILIQQGTATPDQIKRLPKLEKRLRRLKLETLTNKQIENMAKAQVHDLFYQINGNMEFHITLRDRKRMLPIENGDALPFLIDDFEMSSRMMIHKITTDTALHVNFGAHESFLQTKDYERITAEYERMIKDNPEMTKELDKEYQNNIQDLTGIWDIMRGRYGRTVTGTADEYFKRAVNLARGYGVVTKLGSMAFSSIADIAMGIHLTGIKRFMGTAIGGLCKTEGWNLSVEEAKALGFVFDTELKNTLPRDILSLSEQMGMNSIPERLMRKMQNFVVKWSGAERLESIKGRMNTMLMQQDILKNCEALVNGTIKDNQRAFLASIGIDAEKAKLFYDSFKQHGKVKDEFYLGGFAKWSPKLRRDFIYTLQAGFEKISLNPQAWEKPLFLSTTSGRLIGQWMGWAFTAYDKIVIAGLQRSDANTIFGILTMVGIAAISEQLREIWTGVREDRRMKSDQILTNALIRSGAIGHVGVMLERISAIAGGKPAYYLAGRTVDNTRIASRERAAIQIMGPTAGTLVDLIGAASLIKEEGRKAENTRSLTKLMPFRNMIPFRVMWDDAEEGLNNMLGIEQPGKQPEYKG